MTMRTGLAGKDGSLAGACAPAGEAIPTTKMAQTAAIRKPRIPCFPPCSEPATFTRNPRNPSNGHARGNGRSVTLLPVPTPSNAAFLAVTLVILPLIGGEVAGADRDFVTPQAVHAFSAAKPGTDFPPGWRA